MSQHLLPNKNLSISKVKKNTAMIEIFIEKIHKQPPTLETRPQRK
jgi:hypothetical protein